MLIIKICNYPVNNLKNKFPQKVALLFSKPLYEACLRYSYAFYIMYISLNYIYINKLIFNKIFLINWSGFCLVAG